MGYGGVASAGNGNREREQQESAQLLIPLPKKFSRPHSDKSEVILEYLLGGKACVCCERGGPFCWKSKEDLKPVGFHLKTQGLFFFFPAFM